LIPLTVVKALTGLGATTIARHIKAETFPAPHRITRRIVRWRAGDIRDWLRAREARPADPFTPRF
jgi:predicted DNA-binding transcriptional regulator AlpA